MPQVCLCGNRRPFGPQRGRSAPEETSPPSARKTSSTVTKRFPIIVFPIFPKRNIIGGRSDLHVRWAMSGVLLVGIAVFYRSFAVCGCGLDLFFEGDVYCVVVLDSCWVLCFYGLCIFGEFRDTKCAVDVNNVEYYYKNSDS